MADSLRAIALDRWQRAFEDSLDTLEDALIAAAPVGETGDTRRGIEVRLGGGVGNGFAGTAISKSPHGDYVEKGTAPHVILPHGRVLRWVGGGGRISQPGPNQRIHTRAGGVQFATIVHHPGTPERPWFGPEVERWPQMLEQALVSLG